MEKKNVVHTERVISKNRAFFFDLKEAENGRQYLVINQSRTSAEGEKKRDKMILFPDELERFSHALLKVIFYFDKKGNEANREAYEAEVRKEYPNAFLAWPKEEEALLKELYQQGHGVEELMVHFKRNRGGIEKRLKMLGLVALEPEAA